MLSEEVVGSGRVLNLLSDAQRAECKTLFSPLFLQLIDHLRELAEFDADSDGWTADTHDDFKRFRYAVGDAIYDSCKVASSVAVISRLMAWLQEKLPAFAADPAGRWREVEGCVFCLRQSISKNDDTFFTSPAVAQFLQLLPTLPDVGLLVPQCIRTVGTYATWLNKNPELLPPLLTFVSGGLGSPKTAPATSQALKSLCDQCADHLNDDATMAQLLQMYRGALALDLQPPDRVDLIAALSSVVSNMAPASVVPTMQAIAAPLVEALQQNLASASGTAGEVALLLEQLCALLRGVSPRDSAGTDTPGLQDSRHPSLELLQQLWSTLESVFVRHGSSASCMEKLCRCYRHTARTCGPAFQTCVPQLLPQVTGWYEQQPHSCFVYMCNVCIGAFVPPNGGGDALTPAILPVVAESFSRISTATFTLLSKTADAIVSSPDVVDDFFELCSKVLRKQPSLLLESPVLGAAMQCGCAALHIQHKEAGRSVVCFFENMVEALGPRARVPLTPASLAALQGMLAAHGPQLVSQLVLAVAGHLPPQRVRFLAPLLQALMRAAKETFTAWATDAVRTLPAAAHTDGQIMLAAMTSAECWDSERAFFACVEGFSDACRRKRITG